MIYLDFLDSYMIHKHWQVTTKVGAAMHFHEWIYKIRKTTSLNHVPFSPRSLGRLGRGWSWPEVYMAMSGWQPRTSRLKSRRSAMVEGLQVAQIYKPPFESAGCVRFLSSTRRRSGKVSAWYQIDHWSSCLTKCKPINATWLMKSILSRLP